MSAERGPGRKLKVLIREIPGYPAHLDDIAFAVSIVRSHWGHNYRLLRYDQDAPSDAAGYVLFQVHAADGARFVLGVNARTGDWWHADTFLKIEADLAHDDEGRCLDPDKYGCPDHPH